MQVLSSQACPVTGHITHEHCDSLVVLTLEECRLQMKWGNEEETTSLVVPGHCCEVWTSRTVATIMDTGRRWDLDATRPRHYRHVMYCVILITSLPSLTTSRSRAIFSNHLLTSDTLFTCTYY